MLACKEGKRGEGGDAAQPSARVRPFSEVGLESDGDSRSVSKHGNEQLNEGEKK